MEVAALTFKNMTYELHDTNKAVSPVLGQRTIEHAQLRGFISEKKSTIEKDDKGPKSITPQELFRFYDLLGQSWRDLSDSCSSGRECKLSNASFAEESFLNCLVLQAERYFFLAKAYSKAGTRSESYALFCHARSLTYAAVQKLHMTYNPDKDYGSYVRETLLVQLGENLLFSWAYWILVSFISKVTPYAGAVTMVCDGTVSFNGGYGGVGIFVITEEGEFLFGGSLKTNYKGSDSSAAELIASGATFDICSFMLSRGSKFVNDNIVPIKIMHTCLVNKPELFELATKIMNNRLLMKPLAIQASCTLLSDHLAQEGKEADGDYCFNFGDKDYCIVNWYEGDGCGNIYRMEAGKKTGVLVDANFIKKLGSTLYAMRYGGWKDGKPFDSLETCVAKTLKRVADPYLDRIELTLVKNEGPTSKPNNK